MNDLEITKLCAEAMGIVLMSWDDHRLARMYLTEKLQSRDDAYYKLDGKLEGSVDNWEWFCWESNLLANFNPLHDDAQAMALVKKFGLDIISDPDASGKDWDVRHLLTSASCSTDLNRAICECVAKMQKAKANA